MRKWLLPVWVLCLLFVSAAGAAGRTEWEPLAPLPDEQGFAGAFTGTSGGALIVAGGTNFPQPVWENEKVWHDRIFVLPDPAGEWGELGRLPRPIGLGMSVSYRPTFPGPDVLVCIGGDDGQRAYADVFTLEYLPAERRIVTTPLPDLPTPLTSGGAAVIGDTLYVIGGQTGIELDTATARGFKLDLASASPQWQELPELPGGSRAYGLVVAQHDGTRDLVYVIGGRRVGDGVMGMELLRDTWAFDPAEGAWVRKADAPAEAMAGAAAALGQSHVILLGYADGAALRHVEERAIEMRDYEHPGFPREALLYHTITNTWTSGGEIPANQVATTAVSWGGGLVMASGEVSPRVRTPAVWRVSVPRLDRPFGWLNYASLTTYLAAMLGVGVVFAFRNKSSDDYFRGGQNVPWWAASLSIFATMLSSITFMAVPAKAFATDWVYMVGNFTVLATAPLAVYVALPFFRQIDATSAYEYLEKRFNRPVRLFGSGLFTLFHLFRMGVVLSLAGLALDTVTPLTAGQCVLLMGVLCLLYCTLGGIEAVIWSDVIQTVVLLGGALLCIVLAIVKVEGGVLDAVGLAYSENKLHMVNLDFDLASYSQMALWVVLLGGIGQNISSYTADQAIVQRYMTTETQAKAAKAIWLNGFMSAVPASLIFYGLGTALYIFYKQHPQKLDPTFSTDQILPQFIINELPAGVAGIVIAGIFAAAQSTVSTSMNSTATTVVTDFLRPLGTCRTDRGYLNLGRVLTLTAGILGTLAGLVFVDPSILSLFDAFIVVVGVFLGVLGGMFLLGMLTRRANGWGAFIGVVVGAITMLVLSKPALVLAGLASIGLDAPPVVDALTAVRRLGIHWYLYSFIAVGTSFIVGYLASIAIGALGMARHIDLDGLTVHTLKPRAEVAG